VPCCRAVPELLTLPPQPTGVLQLGKDNPPHKSISFSLFTGKSSGKGTWLLKSPKCRAQLGGGVRRDEKGAARGLPKHGEREGAAPSLRADPAPSCGVRPCHSAGVARWGFARPVPQVGAPGSAWSSGEPHSSRLGTIPGRGRCVGAGKHEAGKCGSTGKSLLC